MADSRHKRDTDARRKPRAVTLAGSIAVLATGAAVVAGVALQHPSSSLVAEDAAAHATATPSAVPSTTETVPDLVQDRMVLSRSNPRSTIQRRPTVTRRALPPRRPAPTPIPDTREKRWTTTALNLWTAPGSDATQVDVLAEGAVVYWTGRTLQDRDEIFVDGVARYVTHGYLSDQKPVPTPAGLSDAPCPDSSVESGLASDTIKVYRSVCHAFPQVTHYIGWGARSEHDTGHALDVMVYGDKALGDAIAAWAQAHASELNLYDIIWYDRIWTPVRSSEGWRDYGDHGSATANHMDHVHIGTN